MWASGLLIGWNKLNILHLLLEWQLDHRDSSIVQMDKLPTFYEIFIVRFIVHPKIQTKIDKNMLQDKIQMDNGMLLHKWLLARFTYLDAPMF